MSFNTLASISETPFYVSYSRGTFIDEYFNNNNIL